ncbi:MAG: hypothetical protein ACOYB3_01330 [Azonexus sp.]
MFGRVIFPERVVQAALAATATAAERIRSIPSKGLLELCRYETWEPGDDFTGRDGMTAFLAESGSLLEVIGHVHELKIVNGTLKAVGEMQDNLRWRYPVEQHTPVPYMELKAENVIDPISSTVMRRVTIFAFTEIVMVFQAVTDLALRKYRERKSLLAVDKS